MLFKQHQHILGFVRISSAAFEWNFVAVGVTAASFLVYLLVIIDSV